MKEGSKRGRHDPYEVGYRCVIMHETIRYELEKVNKSNKFMLSLE